ncbi:hypothetical protein Spb1_08450 [Planctopirus ephydatiae]|uniref:Uncharacterized protein n=1 Tax=Planctopirus ephydatiae TaxID=2528019 RepID=A0A518GK80_9PLAN|nr:hypothetical protein Spb1_08450 [Planctopirus ephydatiae]
MIQMQFPGRLQGLNQSRHASQKTEFKTVRKVVGYRHALQEYAEMRGVREKSLGQN